MAGAFVMVKLAKYLLTSFAGLATGNGKTIRHFE
jgi:hypothetical protein